MSERDGWNHLYLYDTQTGRVKNPITQGEWVVRSVERVDEEKRQIWFRACGNYPKQDPYYIHYGRVNFDGSGLTWLTSADGTHKLEFSPNGQYYLDTYSRVDMPPISEVHQSSDGKKVAFARHQNGSFDIVSVELGQNRESTMVAGPDHATFPAFSPDGRKLAFISDRTGATEVYLVPLSP